MSRKRLLFCLSCVLLWPAGIFVASEMHTYISYVVWWFATQAGSTHMSRVMFSVTFLLPLGFVDGFLLGLIPIDRLRAWLASSLARFHYREPIAPTSELNPMRPVLWAWVLPTCLFCLRFITWSPPQGHSIMTDPTSGATRLIYFFGTPTDYAMSLDTLRWSSDRIFITLPVIFFLAYPAAVLVRHRFIPYIPTPSLDHALIHSAPDPNPIEPTENPAQHGTRE